MIESVETIRGNIKRYERLLTVESSAYTHENVGKLLTEAKVQLRIAVASVLSGKI